MHRYLEPRSASLRCVFPHLSRPDNCATAFVSCNSLAHVRRTSTCRKCGVVNGQVAQDAPQGAPQRIVNDRPSDTIRKKLVYEGIIFDMDGTLSVSYIDYVKMRSSIDIPYGDLFTVMETWTDGQRIKAAVEIILDIESKAAVKSHAMPGMYDLLDFLRRHDDVKIGLVTRNTVNSVDAFFSAIGEEWREVFDIVLTRDNIPFVKPDKRCLLHFANMWDVEPQSLLMVGDSTEDVECGNAAGTATCLIAGGGNETTHNQQTESTVGRSHPPGAVPTFEVSSLEELMDRLERRDTSRGCGSDSIGSHESTGPGSPAQGLDFMDWLFNVDALEAAACSFPRIDAAHSSQIPDDQHPGSKVLHIECGNGALTKHLFSSGLFVVGVDSDHNSVEAASRRGLAAMCVDNLLQRNSKSLKTCLESAEYLTECFDAAIHIEGADASELRILENDNALSQVWEVLREGGSLCVRCREANGARRVIEERLNRVGFRIVHWEEEPPAMGLLRVVATKI